ncbi:MAG: sigma-70 family RNA polymerase sigma factor [Nitriliruptorales bacterium]|nr:sigma-70 family RNA polymerase sigma factor [Nitriliruptorales bacterium]
MDRPPNADLVARAQAGEQDAWDAIVAAYEGLVWSVVRSFRLSDAEAHDITQTTWLRLVENLGSIREPNAIGGWLATTARRECIAAYKRSGRSIPTDPATLDEPDETVEAPGAGVFQQERAKVVWEALHQLGDKCFQLLRILLADPPPTYIDVSAALEMPIGSIGPTRQRCLENLRALLERRGITGEFAAS